MLNRLSGSPSAPSAPHPSGPGGTLGPLSDTEGGPLYRQVKRALLRLIEAGRYRPGHALPSEQQIARIMGVSIGTLRRAVDELVLEHVLVRRQGKGTFVATHGQERFLFQFFHVQPRHAEELERREYPSVEFLSFERLRASDDEAAALRIRPADPVLTMHNRLSLAGRAVVIDRITLSAALFKGLTEKRFVDRDSTVYSLYQKDFGITVLRARERTRAVAASREVARLLGVQPGLPVLEVHREALTFGDRPVEYRISTINTRHHDYVSLLSQPT